MNILSLRVSAIKGNENLKKNSDLRMDLLKLNKSVGIQAEKFYEKFAKTISIEEQIRVVRELSVEISREVDGNEKIRRIQILSEIYFQAPLKHPVKNTVIKILLQMSSSLLKNEVISCLNNTLKSSLDASLTIEDAEQLNDLTNALNGCLENFPPGLEAVRMSLQNVIFYLNRTFSLYLQFLGNSLSPTQKNEYSLFLHNSIRLLQACLQQFSNQINNSINLSEIISNCHLVIKCPDIPMDTKINCGSIIALEAKITSKYSDFILELNSQIIKENQILRLCLTTGFVNTFDNSDIIPNTAGFKVLQYIVESFCDIGKYNSLESNIILAVSRGLLQLSKKLLLLNLNMNERTRDELNDLKITFQLCQTYSLCHMEHYLDSVRHLARDILKNITQFCVRYKEYFLIWMTELYNIGKQQPAVIASLCNVLGAEKVLNHVPNLVEIMLSKLQEQTITFEILMMSNSKEIPLEDWYQRWIIPLILNLTIEGENLIKKSIKEKPEIVYKIIKEKLLTDQIALKLNCVGTARKQGFFDNIESNAEKWKNILLYDELEMYIQLENDFIAIASLRLLAEAHKTTEIFEIRELEIVYKFLKLNINCQSPSTRQQIRAYMKIILLRIQSVIPVLIRTKQENEYDYHFNFLIKLQEFFLKNLYAEANFSRREVSLKLLFQVVGIFNQILSLRNLDNNLWNEEKVENLLESLDDTYEVNQRMAIQIMELCPKEIFQVGRITLGKTLNMASSIKPSDSTIAAYYFEFLTKISPDLNKLKLVLGTSQPTKHSLEIYLGLLWCYTNLQEGLKIANISLLKAAQKNPLYGFLFCLRHLISGLDLKEISTCSIWQDFFKKLIILCKELTDVVGPIVNNSSPEGHLPNDFSEATNFISDDEPLIKSTTPQMILLCAWRTVKEVSLLLGDISLRAPIINRDKQKQNGLITVEQILEMGIHFTELLSETKHRGVFEQAYIGFSKLCVRLWSASEKELHILPMKWLNDLINVISGDKSDFNSEKLCSTRRSAGVPFMVQALITSELQVCSSNGLHLCMNRLIKLCRNGKLTESRTHALNILRAIFRCSDLGETITEYISDGLECAIRGYDAETWPEQNSSTLLFSALIVRIFGVQRNRDSENLNIRNKMTGRIFFLRYPRLYDFFLMELKEAGNTINKIGNKSTKLHPILLILSRLYPSALEGSESNLKLIEFLQFISVCSSSPEFPTRCLVAKSTVALITHDRVTDRIMELIKIIQELYLSKGNSNLLHGIQLQILALVRSGHLFDFSDWNKIMFSILFVEIKNRKNMILLRTYSEILVELILLCDKQWIWDQQLIKKWNSSLEIISMSYDKRNSEVIGHSDLTNSFILLKLYDSIRIKKIDLTSPDILLNQPLDNHPVEYVETILNLIILIIDYENCTKLTEDFEFTKNEIRFVEKILKEQINLLKTQIFNNVKVGKSLTNILKNQLSFECTFKALTVISYSGNFIKIYLNRVNFTKEDIKSLLLFSDENPDQLKIAVFKCIQRIIEELSDSIDLKFLIGASMSENDEEIRRIVAEILLSLKWNRIENQLLEYSRIVLILLKDDSEEVRFIASNVVTKLIQSESTCALRAFYAQEKFLIFITDYIRRNESSTHVIKYLLRLVGFELNGDGFTDEGDNAENQDEIRVFNRNEMNVFSERFETIWMCFRILQSELINNSIKIRDIREEVLKGDKDLAELLEKINDDKLDVRKWIQTN